MKNDSTRIKCSKPFTTIPNAFGDGVLWSRRDRTHPNHRTKGTLHHYDIGMFFIIEPSLETLLRKNHPTALGRADTADYTRQRVEIQPCVIATNFSCTQQSANWRFEVAMQAKLLESFLRKNRLCGFCLRCNFKSFIFTLLCTKNSLRVAFWLCAIVFLFKTNFKIH